MCGWLNLIFCPLSLSLQASIISTSSNWSFQLNIILVVLCVLQIIFPALSFLTHFAFLSPFWSIFYVDNLLLCWPKELQGDLQAKKLPLSCPKDNIYRRLYLTERQYWLKTFQNIRYLCFKRYSEETILVFKNFQKIIMHKMNILCTLQM